jgi:hypothetical protein
VPSSNRMAVGLAAACLMVCVMVLVMQWSRPTQVNIPKDLVIRIEGNNLSQRASKATPTATPTPTATLFAPME